MIVDNILINAVQRDDVQEVEQLVTAQPNLMAEPGMCGDTALHCVAWNGNNEANSRSAKIFDILLITAVKLQASEMLLNIQNIMGETPFTRALSRAETTSDIFTQRSVSMIQCGAILPDTPHAKRTFEKLPLAVQKFIQDQLYAYQQKINADAPQGKTTTGLRHRKAIEK